MTPEEAAPDSIEQLLRSVRESNSDITGVAVVTSDGFSVASDLEPDLDEEAVAALTADLLGHAARSMGEFGRGDCEELHARGEGGYVMAFRAGSEAALVCLANRQASLGLLMLDMRRAAAKAAELM
jgi:predicted regulator of Ras-like GTPase activity (Roadblock/LC7/MglB family)